MRNHLPYTPKTIDEAAEIGARDAVYSGSIRGAIVDRIRDFIANEVQREILSQDEKVANAFDRFWKRINGKELNDVSR